MVANERSSPLSTGPMGALVTESNVPPPYSISIRVGGNWQVGVIFEMFEAITMFVAVHEVLVGHSVHVGVMFVDCTLEVCS